MGEGKGEGFFTIKIHWFQNNFTIVKKLNSWAAIGSEDFCMKSSFPVTFALGLRHESILQSNHTIGRLSASEPREVLSRTVLKTVLQNIRAAHTIKMPLPYHNRIVKDRRNFRPYPGLLNRCQIDRGRVPPATLCSPWGTRPLLICIGLLTRYFYRNNKFIRLEN
jgi:hypothetical protein